MHETTCFSGPLTLSTPSAMTEQPWWEPWDWRSDPPPPRRTSFYWPCRTSGPMTLEWACASYEALAARTDSNKEYSRAAFVCQKTALDAILAEGYSRNVTYAERLAL